MHHAGQSVYPPERGLVEIDIEDDIDNDCGIDNQVDKGATGQRNGIIKMGSMIQTTMSYSIQQEIQLRFLCPDDIPEVKLLCAEWFPIE